MTQSTLSRSIPKKAPSCFALKDDLFPAAAPVVTLPAGEAALLTRIAEVAEELTFPEKEKSMKKHMSEWYELVSLVSEWRQEWRKR